MRCGCREGTAIPPRISRPWREGASDAEDLYARPAVELHDAATAAGIQTVLQTPLRTSGKTVGVLGLYGTDANAFSVGDRETASRGAGRG